jgi:hypothetical protein
MAPCSGKVSPVTAWTTRAPSVVLPSPHDHVDELQVQLHRLAHMPRRPAAVSAEPDPPKPSTTMSLARIEFAMDCDPAMKGIPERKGIGEQNGGPGGNRTLDHSIKSRVLYR